MAPFPAAPPHQCPRVPAPSRLQPIVAPARARCRSLLRSPRPFLPSRMTLESPLRGGISITRGRARPLVSFFGAVNEQRAFGLERAEMRIVAVIVNEDPRRAAISENTKNIFEARRGVGPVIGRFHGNHVREKVRLPGYLRDFSRD